MALGSLFLWTVIPFGWLRLSASLSDRYTAIYVLALLGCPVAMLLWGWGLYRINRIYLRLADPTGSADGGPWDGSRGIGLRRERRLTLLDALLVVSAAIALILLVLWWLALAHPPTSAPWPSEP